MIVNEATNQTPYVFFNEEIGIFEIKGKLINEDPGELFADLIACVREYELNPRVKTEVNIILDYYNSRSAKYLLSLFNAFESIHKKNGWVTINWYYEEDDECMKEDGEVYESIIKIPFNIIKIPC